VLERLDGEARDTVAEPDNVATSGQSRFENDQDQE
jgi:hypothetical protein